VYENRVLRRIFGPKRKEVAGEWRRLHNEELHNLYASTNIVRIVKSRRMQGAEHVARIEEMRNTYSNFVGKPKWKTPVGRRRR
jgi:hypothetical protein